MAVNDDSCFFSTSIDVIVALEVIDSSSEEETT